VQDVGGKPRAFNPTAAFGVAIGLGLIIIGAGKGIGSIGSHAVDSTARQPEAGGGSFTTMILSAALIEGVTLFAIAVAFLALLEMRKAGEIAVSQAAPFAPIRISRAASERSLAWTAHSA